MTKTTYVAIAPDGSQHIRKTERSYSHAVLLEGKQGWGTVGFCGRFDLAEKKCREHPGSIVVECGVFGAGVPDEPESQAAEKSELTAPEANSKPKRPQPNIGALVEDLLMDPNLGYEAIVEQVVAEFPDARTSVRSVASVAAVLRKKGTQVPMRRPARRS